MTVSVDYRVYCQAASEEAKRLTKVYQGAEDDQALASQHLLSAHLDRLLAGDLTQALRSYYNQQRDILRANMRALALVHLTRRDYYAHASHVALREADRFASSIAYVEELGRVLASPAPPALRETLANLEDEYAAKKIETELEVRAHGGLGSAVGTRPEDTLRVAVGQTPGVNSRGVSNDETHRRG